MKSLTSLKIAIIALILGAIGAVLLVTPSFQDIRGPEPKNTSLPVEFQTTGRVTVSLLLNPGLIEHSLWYIQVDDCLKELLVNGTPALANLPFCDYDSGLVVDFNGMMRPGKNLITAVIENDGGDGRFSIQPAKNDPGVLAKNALCAALFFIGALVALRGPLSRLEIGVSALLLMTAFVLRVFYFDITPYPLRSHDASGHLEYVNHVLAHWSIPDTGAGWEFYQPPLYYFLSAGFLKLTGLFGIDYPRPLQLQTLAVLISSLWLILQIPISRILFADLNQRLGRIIYLSVAGFFPAIILHSAQINNDILTLLLMTLAALFIFKWWRSLQSSDFLYFALFCGLGVLTKMNSAAILAAGTGALLIRTGFPIRKKFALLIALVAIIAGLNGWFAYRKYVTESQSHIIGNVGNLNSGLEVGNNLSNYLIFNPIKVLEIPFNHPWLDVSRRNFFAEYLFRSSLFGEFNFAKPATGLSIQLVFIALQVLALSVMAIVFAIKRRADLWIPAGLILFVVLAQHVTIRALTPYSSTQDFRYSQLLVLSLAYFLGYAAQMWSSWIRPVACWILFSWVATVFVFFIQIYLGSPA